MLIPFLLLVTVLGVTGGCASDTKNFFPTPLLPSLKPALPQVQPTIEPWLRGPALGWEETSRRPGTTDRSAVRQWVSSIKNGGVNTLVVQQEFSRRDHQSERGWTQLAAEAHRQGVRVFTVLNLREESFGETQALWRDARFQNSSRSLRSSRSPDLFHPGFQAEVTSACRELAAAAVDLIIFRFDPSSGPLDGFSQHGLEGFQRDFEQRLSPVNLFRSPLPMWAQESSRAVRVSQTREEFSPDFWRWVGWKNREYLSILDRIMDEVRQEHPGMKFGIELRADTMVNPRRALVRYAEDFLESRRHMFDQYIVVATDQEMRNVTGQPLAQAATQMTELLDDPSKVFVLVSGRSRMWSTVKEAAEIKAALGLQQGVGLVFRGDDGP